MKNPNYKNKNTERKYLNIMRRNQILQTKNSLKELEKDFIELKVIDLKDRAVKIKRETEELFFKPIIVSVDYMDRFEKKEIKKIRPIKYTWYDWLISYIPEPIRKSVDGFKDKLVSFFQDKHT